MTQIEALHILKSGCNVYLTGSAGSGKTYVLNRYIDYLKNVGIKAGITASTGVAATHIDGLTINSWAGIGIKKVLGNAELEELLKRKYLHKRFRNTKVLIIDEVSMLPSYTFEAVDRVLRTFRQDPRPFGGIQIVLSGDFFQLPPVSRDGEEIHFVYESPLWNSLDLKVCYLSQTYRQIDGKFLHVLKEIRENNLTGTTWETLKERFITPLSQNITPTKLYTHNADADNINQQELDNLKAKSYTFLMKAEGNEALITLMKKNCLAPEKLVLKKGALVMFVKNNFEEGYVNGTMGKVTGFEEKNGYPLVQAFSGRVVKAIPAEWEVEEDVDTKAKITQIPLRLAWGITIHKSQGMTLDAAELDLGRSFEHGMGYVALTRVRTLQGIRLRSICRTALTVNEKIIQLDKRLQKESEDVEEELKNSYWYKKNLHKEKKYPL